MTKKDEGAFECQLNTMPSRSLVVHLQVGFATKPPSDCVCKVEDWPGTVGEERTNRKGEEGWSTH